MIFFICKQKNYAELLPLIRSLTIDQQQRSQLPKYQHMVRSSLISLRFHIPNGKTEDAAIKNAFTAYADMLRMSAQRLGFTGFMDCLRWITRKTDLEQCMSLLTAVDTKVLVRQWLRAVTDSMHLAIDSDSGSSDDAYLKQLYIDLTAVAVIFVRVEVAHPILGDDGQTIDQKASMAETLRLLELCAAVKRFTEPMYAKCFKLLSTFLLGLQTSVDFSRACPQLEKEFR